MDLTESVTLVRRRLGDVLFVDFEFDGRDRIAEVGAVFGDERYHWTDATDAERKLASLAARATFVAGHNVHAHDLPIVSRHWPRHPLLAVRAIDTLLWSPIAFPERPYHRLVKDRELVRLEGNDPLADADASRKVLADELAWLTSRPADDAQLPLVRRGLVDHVGTALWRGGAEAMLGGVPDLPLREALTLASRDWRDQVCLTALARLGQEAQDRGWRALGCAYASRWLTTPPGSVLPPWVWRTLPEARAIVTFLRDQDCGACAWCGAQHSPEGQLRRWFGHPAFRDKPVAPDGTSLQRAIVAAGLRDESQFAVLPTGGGKSICFQVPAFARYARRGALTVVISPLQSLMKDQVDNLVRNTGTAHVAALYGALTLPERQDVMERVRQGEVGLLYVSPEQLRNPGVRKLLESREIGSWVFDEAHCIAEWGHDFRPDFWYAPRFVRELAEKQGVPVPPIAAFTATAQPEVVRQILERVRGVLGIELTRFDGGAERTNLDYRVEACPPRARLGRVIELLEPLRNAAGAAVVFAPTRKECERVAAELVRQGWAAAAYHAGLETKLRRDTQDRFLNGDLRVIAATSAFGMGGSRGAGGRPPPRATPSSLESYLQQAGRAGRDGQPAECVLLHVPADLERLLVAENRGRLRQDEIQRVLRAVRKFSKRGRTEITPGELARLAGDESADDRDAETRSVTAVAWLERAEILRRDENRPRVFQGRPRIRQLEEARRVLEREGIAGVEADAAIAMLQALWQRRGESGSADDLAQLAGLCHSLGMDGDAYGAGLRAIELLERMVRAGILAEGLQLSASLAVGVQRSSQALLEGVAALQRALLDLVRELHPDPELGDDGACELDVVALCRELVARGAQDAVPDAVRRLLQAMGADKGPEGRPSWTLQHAGGRRYRVRFDVGWDEIVARVRRRLAVSSLVLETLTSRREDGSKGNEVVVEFAFTDLTDAITSDMLLGIGTGEAFTHAERALLFLHDVRVIELRNGLAVFRSAMSLKLEKDAQRRKFSKEDYEPLLEHYESRKVQVHAMNVYAVEGVKSAALGRQVARDWFTRTRKDFQARWLREALAADRAERILNVLDEDQQRIVRAPADRNLVVVAGPGSGKTTTVVHRVAWLVHEHDVRPEGVLVLCYNRATATEIRERLRKALGELGTGVTVLTLHALALRLTGTSLRTADEDRFDRVLEKATELLRSRDERPCLGADELRDLLLTAPDGATGVLVVEAKRRLAPGSVPSVRAGLQKQEEGSPVVFAGWLSRLTQEALREAGIGYLDLTGNLDIRLDRPGLYLRDVGADRDPEPAPSALKSLKGAGAARAVRALVDFAPPYGVRELAAASGASAALVSRVLGLLEKEALVERENVITHVDWEKVLARWAEDYDFTRANRVVTAIDPRGAAAFVRKLASYGSDWAATGALGTPAGVRVVPLQVVAIYVRSPEQTLSDLGLTPTDGGANVLLVEPPDDGPFARAERSEDGVVRCAPSQVVADLLTGPGRGASEARPVLEWMKRNESAWRRRP